MQPCSPELAELILDAARILKKGITTRSNEDSLSCLLELLDHAEQGRLALEEAHKTLVARLRAEMSDMNARYREELNRLASNHNEVVLSYERQLGERKT